MTERYTHKVSFVRKEHWPQLPDDIVSPDFRFGCGTLRPGQVGAP